jgi:hypothetical protein
VIFEMTVIEVRIFKLQNDYPDNRNSLRI